MQKHRLQTTIAALLVIGMLASPSASAQEPPPLRSIEVGALSFDETISAAKSSMMSEPQSALENARRGEELARTLSNPVQQRNAMATSLWLQGEAMTRLNRAAEALPLLERAKEYVDETELQLSGDLLLSMGRARRVLEQEGAALEDFQNAYGYFEQTGASRSQAIALQSIGTLYDDARQYMRAIEYYTRASDAYSDGSMFDLVSANNRAIAYRELGDYAPARTFSNEALAMAEKSGSSLLQARILTNIAVLEIEDGDFDAAADAIKSGFEHVASDDAKGWAPFLWGAQAKLAYAQGDLAMAEEAIVKTFDGADVSATAAPFRDFHEAAYLIYQSAQKYDAALSHLEAFKRLDDRGRDIAATANRAILNAEFEFANQELEIEKLHIGQLERDIELGRHRQRQQLLVTLGAGVIGVGIIAFFILAYRSSRKNQKITEAFNRELESKNNELAETNVELEEANQAKTEFLATTSHEIRTPLNAIIGLSDVVLNGEAIIDRDREYLELVNKSGRHLLSIVNDILDVSKLESGTLIVDKEPFNIGGCVLSVAEIWRNAAEEKGLKLHVDVDPEADDYISDGRLIRQIVSNLLSNAVKFTAEGKISVSLATNDADGFEIAVQDTGIGVPLEMQEKIFEAFRQADGSTRRKYEGTGLGLAICKRIALALGGDVKMKSAPGEGALFTVSIPAARARKTVGVDDNELKQLSSVANEAGCDHSILDEMRILVAEDNAANAMVIRALLSKRVGVLDIVENGAEAVKAVQAREYDIILMDKQMPVMDGVEAAKAIRALPSSVRDVPIIAVTADAYASARKEVLQAGMNDFVSKPLTAGVLCDAMVRSLESRKAAA